MKKKHHGTVERARVGCYFKMTLGAIGITAIQIERPDTSISILQLVAAQEYSN
jgi:hypothetical protein